MTTYFDRRVPKEDLLDRVGSGRLVISLPIGEPVAEELAVERRLGRRLPAQIDGRRAGIVR